MSTVPTPLVHPPAWPRCPVCDLVAISREQHFRDGVNEATFVCPNDHLWLTKWPPIVVAAPD